MPAILKNFSKFNVIILIAGIVTLALFYTMQLLIMTENGVPMPSARRLIDDITMPDIKILPIHVTPRPEQPEDPPPIPELESVVFTEGPPTIISGPIPTGEVDLDDSGFGQLGPANGNAMPIAQIQPDYPTRAASNGIEGYAIVQFDVNENGTVINAHILGAEPVGMFERASLRAIERWRYQPRLINGKAVPMRGLQTRFSFNLRE